MLRDDELILRLLNAGEAKALYRLWVKRLHRAQRDLEQARLLEDVRMAQGRIDELRFLLTLRKRLRKKMDTGN